MANERDEIPKPVKREVRQRCGFGCVLCGGLIYEYHHVKPWSEVRKHEAQNLTLLCDSCHRRVTSGLIPECEVVAATNAPHNLQRAQSNSERLHFSGSDLRVDLGGGWTFNIDGSQDRFSPLVVEGASLIEIAFEDGRPLISLRVHVDEGPPLLLIEDNELRVNVNAWDITFIGRLLTIRAGRGDILFEIYFEPPCKIHIRRGFFFWAGTAIEVDDDAVRVINNQESFKGCAVGPRKWRVGLAIGSGLPEGGLGGFLSESWPWRFVSLQQARRLDKPLSALFQHLLKSRESISKSDNWEQVLISHVTKLIQEDAQKNEATTGTTLGCPSSKQ